jgi:hypothetical protein
MLMSERILRAKLRHLTPTVSWPLHLAALHFANPFIEDETITEAEARPFWQPRPPTYVITKARNDRVSVSSWERARMGWE